MSTPSLTPDSALPETPSSATVASTDALALSKSRALQLESDVVQYCDRLYDNIVNDREREKEVRETLRQIDFLEGRHWREGQRSQRNRPVLNKVKRHFWDQVGLLTDLSLDYTVKMFNKLNDFSEFEKLLNQLAVHWAQSNDVKFTDRLYDVTLYGLLHTGPAKIQWNSSKMGGMGDVDIIPIAPWQFGCIGAGSDPQESECISYFPVVTRDHIARRYGRELAMRVECDMEYAGASLSGQFKRPSNIDRQSWARMNEGLRASVGIKSSSSGNDASFPMAMCKEFWMRDNAINDSSRTVVVGPHDGRGRPAVNWAYFVEPGMPLYPRGRVIVTAGGAVLEDNPNPYWHSRFPFPVFRPFRLPWKMSGDCHDDKTEVLTQRGWIKFEDLQSDDFLATRKIQTGEFEWQLPNAVVKKPHHGEMYHFTSRSMDICVTPTHRMLLNGLPLELDSRGRSRGCKGHKQEGVCTAEELSLYGNLNNRIPQTSVWRGVEIGLKVFEGDIQARKHRMLAKTGRVGKTGMTEACAVALAETMGKRTVMSGDDYCAFMGAFLSEGWTSKWCVHIGQFEKSKAFATYRDLLTRILGFTPHHNGKDFTVSRVALRNHCREFGLKSFEKFVPTEIMNATPHQIRIFWDSYLLGDGSIDKPYLKGGGTEQITTTSRQMADQLMELAQKMGYSAAVRERRGGPCKILGKDRNSRNSYVITLRRSKAMHVNAEKINYDGMVYCATVPNGFLYTRRNGKPTWSGNSQMKSWIQMNVVINSIMGGMLDFLQSVNEPTLIAPKGAFPPADWDALDPGASGGKIKYNNNAPRAPEFAKRAEMPVGANLQFINLVEKELDMSSGASAMQAALGKKQVPGGDSLEMILNSRSLPVKVESRSLGSFIEDGGWMAVSNMLQFYSVAHRVNILGAKGFSRSDYRPVYGEAIPAGMMPEEFVRKFQGIVKRDTLLASSKADKIQYAFALAKMGKLSDRNLFRVLDDNFDFDANKAELLEEAMVKMKVAAAAQALSGAAKGAKK